MEKGLFSGRGREDTSLGHCTVPGSKKVLRKPWDMERVKGTRAPTGKASQGPKLATKSTMQSMKCKYAESTRLCKQVTEHTSKWGEGTSLPSRRISKSYAPPWVRALLRDPLPKRTMWQGEVITLDKPGNHDPSQVIKVDIHRESLWRAGTLDRM